MRSVAEHVAAVGLVLVGRDCCVCGEKCVVPAGVPWRAARCHEHQGQ